MSSTSVRYVRLKRSMYEFWVGLPGWMKSPLPWRKKERSVAGMDRADAGLTEPRARVTLTPQQRADLVIRHCRRLPQERPRDMFFRFWGDNPFEWPAIDPLSTFSVDVDTAATGSVHPLDLHDPDPTGGFEGPAKLQILGLVDIAHAASPNQPHDAEVVDQGPLDQGWG